MLTLVLCLGAFVPAAAADENYVPNAAITKILQTPVGTTLPSVMDFVFEIRPVKWDNAVYNGSNMPSFADVTLTYSADLKTLSANAASAGATNPYTAGGTTCCVLESGNIFDGLTGTWQGAGKYEYAITEKANTFAVNAYTPAADFTEGMTWSGASYTLCIYVLEGTDGALYIDGIGVVKTKDDAGTKITEEKISVVTPGGDDSEYFWSQIEFRNSYWKTPNGNPEDPDTDWASLAISKKITGAAIVTADYNRYFNFTLKVTPPSIIPTTECPAYYCAFVVDANGDIVADLTTDAYAAAADIGNNGTQDYIKFVPGTATAFQLKHGEKLIFVDTPVGTAYQVTEGATPYFLPSYIVTTAGSAAAQVIGNTSQSLATGTEYTGEGQGMLNNLAAFTNTCDSTPETGLDAVPLYGLSLLALVGLAVYIIMKARKKNRYSRD